MQLSPWMLVASLGAVLACAGAIRAETNVEVTDVHLCCGACVKAASNILKEAGVQGKCDQKKRTVTISAPDDKTAQKALDALAKGGFHGKTNNQDLAMKDDSGASGGKTQNVTVTGIHNCCGNCC